MNIGTFTKQLRLTIRPTLWLSALLLVLMSSSVSWGQTTVTLGGGASVTCPAVPTATWTTPPTGVTFSNWSRGSGVTCATASTALSGSGFNTPASGSAGVTANKYYAVTITADATHTFTLTSVVWSTAVSSGTCNFAVMYSNNGGSVTQFGSTATNTSSNTFSGSVSVAAGTSIVLYLVPYGTGAAGTTVRWVNGSTITVTASSVSPTLNAVTLGSALSNTFGTASSSVSFAAGGSNLSTTFDATPQTGYEISSNNSTFSSSAITGISSSGTTLYVRHAATKSVANDNSTTCVVLSGGGASSNANITTSSSGNAVSAAALTVTASAQSKNFGGTAPTSGTLNTNFTVSGLQNSDAASGCTLGYSGSPAGNTSGATVGSYTITPSALTLSSGSTSNYTITYNTGTLTVNAIVPSAPTINSITAGDQQLSVAFSAPSSNGGATITDYKYSTNGGTSFTSAGTTSSPIVISGLNNGTTYDVQLRAVNSVGDGTATATTQGTPVAPTAPTINGTATATAFTTTYGTASTAQTFSVSGSNLSTDITATAVTGFEVSSDGSTYGSTATFTQSGGSASGTLYIRLAATAAVSGSYNSQNIALSSTGATTINITTAASGNTVTAKGLTITGLSAASKTYDGGTTVSVTGTPAYSGLVNSESFSVSGSPTWAFTTKTVGTSKAITQTGNYSAPSSNYSITQPTLTADINAATLTISSAAVTTKTYDGSAAATITGSLTGVISPDVVTFTGTGTFASANANTGISVTASCSLSGADNGNYTLTQPSGLTGTINKANQTISFSALASKTTTDAAFACGATSATSGTNALTYASSTPSVATIDASGIITIVGAGNTTITVSQAGSQNYNAASDASQTLTVTLTPVTLSTWSFSSATPSSTASNLTVTDVTQGNNNGTVTMISSTSPSSGYTGSSGTNNAATAAFTGSLSTSSSTYYQFTFTPASSYYVSLTSISFGTRSTSTGPQAYALRSSLDNYASDIATGSISNNSSWSLKSNSSLSLTGTAGQAITFRIYGYSGTGSASSGSANWRIDDLTLSGNIILCSGIPSINTQPSSQTLCAGSAINLSITATSVNTYQWRKGGSNISGATNSSYSLSSATTSDGGSYDVILTGSTACATASSSAVTVTVNALPSAITLSPTSTTICNGSSDILLVASGGTVNNTLSAGTASANTTTTGYPSPFSVYYGGTKQQFIVLASELTAAGFSNGSVIDSIAFNVQSLGSTPLAQQNFKVKIGTTASSTMTTTFLTGASTVYSASTYPASGTVTTGWNAIHFSSGFTWDGSSNIYVETSFSNNITGGSANGVSAYVHTPSATLCAYYRVDLTAASTVESTTTATSISATRPDFKLYAASSSFSWSPTTGLSPTTGDIVTASPTSTTIYTVTSTVNGCSSSANDTVTVNTNTWTGSVNNSWSNAGNWSCGIVPTGAGDILISSGAPVLDVNMTLAPSKTMTINGTGTLKVAPNKELKIQGTANWNGKSVTFQSNGFGTAKLGRTTGTINGATNVTVERYIPNKSGRKYSFLSTAVSETVANSWQQQIHITGPGTGGTSCQSASGSSQPTTNSNGFDATGTNSPSMFYYDQNATTKWNTIPNTSTTIVPGIGYRVLVRGTRAQGCALLFTNPPAPDSVTLSATGTLTQGNVDINIAGNNGFTLLGNPYPADLDFTQFRNDNSGVLTQNFWIYSPQKSSGSYSSYNLNTGIGTNFPNSISNHTIIAPGQAFFVQAQNISNPTVHFYETQKAGTFQPGMFKTTQPTDRVRVSLFGSTSATESLDESVVDYNANGSLNFNPDWDARSMNTGSVIASQKAGEKLAIQSRATLAPGTNDTIALFVDGLAANYTFGFTEHTNFMGDVYLLDKFNNTLQDIKATTNYAFAITADTNSKGANRFALVFKALPCTIKIKNAGVTTVCEPNAVQFVIDPSAAAYTNAEFQWNINGAPIAGATDDNFSVNTTGGGNVSLTVSWTGCNKTSNIKAYTVKPQPTASFIASGPTTFCAGGSVTLTAPTISGYSYTWLNNGVAAGSGASKIFKTAGTYTVVAKLNGCTDTALTPAIVLVNPLPVAGIAATTPTTFCAGDNCTLTATPTGGINYTWINGNITDNTGADANYATTIAGKFKVIVTDNNGCVSKTSTSSVTTKVNPIPNASINAMSSTTISLTGNVKLNAIPSSGVSWQWYKDGNPIANATTKQYIATSGGSYTVAIIKAGCTGTSTPTVVTQTTAKVESGTMSESFVISAYPNPVSDVLTIDVSGIQNPTNPTVEIMNSVGQQVVMKTLSSTVSCELPTANWPSGVYFIRYKDDEGRTGTVKIIKD